MATERRSLRNVGVVVGGGIVLLVVVPLGTWAASTLDVLPAELATLELPSNELVTFELLSVVFVTVLFSSLLWRVLTTRSRDRVSRSHRRDDF